MAPVTSEQARGKPVDKRADIWAFGVVLYEMLTGRRLFNGEDISTTLAAVLTAEPQWDRVPARLQRLLKSCLQKDPNRRLRDIGDAQLLLEDVPAPPRARVLPWIVATTICAVIAAGCAFLWLRRPAIESHAAQFTVDAPKGAAFEDLFAGTAVSPDGRFLVFSASTGGGNGALWLRPVD